MDIKLDDEPMDDFRIGEWAMVGYNNEKGRPVIMYSPSFERVGLSKQLRLLQAWIDLLAREYDRMIDQPEDGGDA